MSGAHVVAIPVPAGWRQVAPPASHYVVSDGLEVDISVVQGLPEDPPSWVNVEIARRAAGRTVVGPTLTRVTTEAGWPALLAEATLGADKLMLVMYEFLELGAVATLTGPAERYDVHRDAVRDVLLHADIRWGAPPITLASLLDGAVRAPRER